MRSITERNVLAGIRAVHAVSTVAGRASRPLMLGAKGPADSAPAPELTPASPWTTTAAIRPDVALEIRVATTPG